MKSRHKPDYLRPYQNAVRRHGSAFRSLLWENQSAQKTRFATLAQLCKFEGRSILDVGCGRADLLEFLLSCGIRPSHYTGLEAMESLATAARRKGRPNSSILTADFIAHPAAMFVQADVVVFSGSLTMLSSAAFYATLRKAHRAAAKELAFNFLASPHLAGEDFLHWHRPKSVRKFAERLGGRVAVADDYLEGDCTVRIRRR